MDPHDCDPIWVATHVGLPLVPPERRCFAACYAALQAHRDARSVTIEAIPKSHLSDPQFLEDMFLRVGALALYDVMNLGPATLPCRKALLQHRPNILQALFLSFPAALKTFFDDHIPGLGNLRGLFPEAAACGFAETEFIRGLSSSTEKAIFLLAYPKEKWSLKFVATCIKHGFLLKDLPLSMAHEPLIQETLQETLRSRPSSSLWFWIRCLPRPFSFKGLCLEVAAKLQNAVQCLDYEDVRADWCAFVPESHADDPEFWTSLVTAAPKLAFLVPPTIAVSQADQEQCLYETGRHAAIMTGDMDLLVRAYGNKNICPGAAAVTKDEILAVCSVIKAQVGAQAEENSLTTFDVCLWSDDLNDDLLYDPEILSCILKINPWAVTELPMAETTLFSNEDLMCDILCKQPCLLDILEGPFTERMVDAALSGADAIIFNGQSVIEAVEFSFIENIPEDLQTPERLSRAALLEPTENLKYLPPDMITSLHVDRLLAVIPMYPRDCAIHDINTKFLLQLPVDLWTPTLLDAVLRYCDVRPWKDDAASPAPRSIVDVVPTDMLVNANPGALHIALRRAPDLFLVLPEAMRTPNNAITALQGDQGYIKYHGKSLIEAVPDKIFTMRPDLVERLYLLGHGRSLSSFLTRDMVLRDLQRSMKAKKHIKIKTSKFPEWVEKDPVIQLVLTCFNVVA